jgi:hypothetical protein
MAAMYQAKIGIQFIDLILFEDHLLNLQQSRFHSLPIFYISDV